VRLELRLERLQLRLLQTELALLRLAEVEDGLVNGDDARVSEDAVEDEAPRAGEAGHLALQGCGRAS